ncbi:MAG: hypothetical protein WBB18_02455, partial [Nodosilinea sp.]
MIGSPSSEFIALCQSQVLLLTQALGAMSTVVYLAETTADPMNPTLVPLVAYPETADLWSSLYKGLAAISEVDEVKGTRQNSSQVSAPLEDWPLWLGDMSPELSTSSKRSDVPKNKVTSPSAELASQGLGTEPATYPLVLPLVHEGVVLGMVVSTRDAQPWS